MKQLLTMAAVFGVLFLFGCGGSNNSANSSNGTNSGGNPGSANTGNGNSNGSGSAATSGTYVYVANHGAGTISTYKLSSDGALTQSGSATASPNVHWLATVGKSFVVAAEDSATSRLELFQINQSSGALTSIGTGTQQSPPTGITADAANAIVYSSTQNGIYAFKVSSSGLSALPGSPYFANPAGQDPRSDKAATSVLLDPAGAYLFAGFSGYRGSGLLDLIGRDSSGALTTRNSVVATGPESLAAFWSGKIIYADNPVLGFFVGNGTLSPVAGGPVVAGQHLASDPAGHYMLTLDSPPGNGQVHVYSVSQSTGYANEVSGSPFSSQGVGPSIVRVDPSSKFAIGANGDNTVTSSPSNTLVVFRFDGSTGALSPVGSPVSTGDLPTDLAFVALP